MTGCLVELATDLWCAETPLKFMGLPITSRMTVIRAPGGLWLHSPVPLGPVKEELDRLGPVNWRVAPNMMHHLFQAPYQEAYPASRLAAPADLQTKRRDLRIDSCLSDPPGEWADWLAAKSIAGNATLSETVFLHRASRTLIITDLAAHIGPWDHWLVRLYGKLNGCYGRLALSYGLKSLFKDRSAARSSIEEVLAWDFDRIIPAHGPIVHGNGKEILRSAFAWLMDARRFRAAAPGWR